MWQIIRNLQKDSDRTIIITTHYLDEAEQLCDRLAIIHQGSLLALGTPYFIKKTFGVGYKVIVQKRHDTPWEPRPILDALESILPQYTQQF